ncbi:hypothetical protein MIZ03_4560 [Rhodoferax lithotrophicus]|uniref:Uncharacterized protein n=1 Tax=Rhodoferax lithotrophicus TaxID=2798804 RepID=A0ABN6DCA7_9BURK|nr:hypothetical protein MIZ03_4560 [Rhodoferax sp. MIZ03]
MAIKTGHLHQRPCVSTSAQFLPLSRCAGRSLVHVAGTADWLDSTFDCAFREGVIRLLQIIFLDN